MLRWFYRFLPILALSAASATASDGNAMKAFHDAVHAGETETVRTMLAADPQLAISADKYGFQPIHLLDMYPDEDVLNLLLANGADIKLFAIGKEVGDRIEKEMHRRIQKFSERGQA